MAKLFIVRHAEVVVDFRVPSAKWRLSEAGRASTRRLALAELWDGVGQIYHSPEPKAALTATMISEIAGLTKIEWDDLRELRVPTIPSTEAFHARMGSYFKGEMDPEFEDYSAARDRIVEAIDHIVEEAQGRSLAMVSHGRILTVLFSHLFQRHMTVEEWQSIGLPDLSVIDLDTWTVERGFFAPRLTSI